MATVPRLHEGTRPAVGVLYAFVTTAAPDETVLPSGAAEAILPAAAVPTVARVVRTARGAAAKDVGKTTLAAAIAIPAVLGVPMGIETWTTSARRTTADVVLGLGPRP